MSTPPTFDHERLDVYKASLEFAALVEALTKDMPRGRSHLSDQLQRASHSIPLNIAEGAGEFRALEKARFYRIAQRSATESAAILDLCKTLGIADRESLEQGRFLLLRIVSMLIRLSKRLQDSGTGTQTGAGTQAGKGTQAGTGTSARESRLK